MPEAEGAGTEGRKGEVASQVGEGEVEGHEDREGLRFGRRYRILPPYEGRIEVEDAEGTRNEEGNAGSPVP